MSADLSTEWAETKTGSCSSSDSLVKKKCMMIWKSTFCKLFSYYIYHKLGSSSLTLAGVLIYFITPHFSYRSHLYVDEIKVKTYCLKSLEFGFRTVHFFGGLTKFFFLTLKALWVFIYHLSGPFATSHTRYGPKMLLNPKMVNRTFDP